MLKTIISPWVAALALQAILVAVLMAKKIWHRFPIFFLYAALGFSFNLALFSIFHSSLFRHWYVSTYWTNEGLGVILGLAVVYEIFNHLFTPYPGLRKLATQIFCGAITFLLILGCIVIYAQPLGQQSHIQAAFLVVEQAVRILEVGLLLFLFLCASAFGLHWRQYTFGMALGLGIFVTVELVALTMRIQFGITANSLFNMVRSISFNSSLFIWIGYLLAPELATSASEMPKRAQLEQWNKAVMELIYQ
ncbi:MAG TPA: hypothetical protein VI636_14210 [Candidatus Angelobacter sp.]